MLFFVSHPAGSGMAHAGAFTLLYKIRGDLVYIGNSQYIALVELTLSTLANTIRTPTFSELPHNLPNKYFFRYCPSYIITNQRDSYSKFVQVRAEGNNKIPGKVSISTSHIFHGLKNITPWYILPNLKKICTSEWTYSAYHCFNQDLNLNSDKWVILPIWLW